MCVCVCVCVRARARMYVCVPACFELRDGVRLDAVCDAVRVPLLLLKFQIAQSSTGYQRLAQQTVFWQ